MNYQRTYNEIIENAKMRGLIKRNNYFERHHIVPRCLGGTNDKSNLVLLTGREHFICHHLLWKISKIESLFYAFNMMLMKSKNHKNSRNFVFTSKQYEIHKNVLASFQSKRTKGKRLSIEHINNVKNSWNSKHPRLGKKHSDETKRLLSKLAKNRKPYHRSEEHKEMMSLLLKGKVNIGQHHTDVVKDKLSLSHSKPIIFQGLFFNSVKEAAHCYNKSITYIKRRIKIYDDSFYI